MATTRAKERSATFPLGSPQGGTVGFASPISLENEAVYAERACILPLAVAERAADRLVSFLADRGVDRVFGIPGGAIAPFFDALVDSGISLVVCQHEMMAVYLASGYARATGLPGVVAVTSGPGVLNTVSGVAAALADEVPLIVLAGEVRQAWAGRGAVQDGGAHGLDILSLFRSIVRHSERVGSAERAAQALTEAWDRAQAHPRGPVLITLPVDVTSATLGPSVAFVGGAAPVDRDPGISAQVAAMWAKAKQPLLLAGIGAQRAGVGAQLARLAYRTRTPIVTDVEGKGVVSERDPMCLGVLGIGAWPSATHYAEQADLVIAVGVRFDDTSTRGFARFADVPLVQIDHDPSRMHRFRVADVGVTVDLAAELERWLLAIPPAAVVEVIGRDARIREAFGAPAEAPRGLVDGFHPAEIVAQLQLAAGPDAAFVSDIGNHLLFAARHLVVEHPRGFFVSHGLGSMGSGIGHAIGLAMAYQGTRPVVAVCGDGGMLMVGTELATCARHQVPVLLAVFDNGSLSMVEHGMQSLYGRSACAEVPEVDFVGLGKSLGVAAATLTSFDQLPYFIELARFGPVLLRVPVAPVAAQNPRVAGFQARQ